MTRQLLNHLTSLTHLSTGSMAAHHHVSSIMSRYYFHFRKHVSNFNVFKRVVFRISNAHQSIQTAEWQYIGYAVHKQNYSIKLQKEEIGLVFKISDDEYKVWKWVYIVCVYHSPSLAIVMAKHTLKHSASILFKRKLKWIET